jgi:hypothetical protein
VTFSTASTFPLRPVNGTREEARVLLRFEDVVQDGRLVLEALPNAIGPTVWRRMLAPDRLATACRQKGIVPILARLVLEGTPGPFSVSAEIMAETAYQIAVVDDDRLVLDVWADLYAPIGRTHGAAPGEGTRVLAGRVFAQHAFTKPFAPAGQRRVTRSELQEVLGIDEERAGSPGLEAVADLVRLPAGAVPLESAPRLDAARVTFGLMHTDSNMHVNSLVYLRVCEEAALRRFADLGRGGNQLGRRIDIAYRKPCFAGQTVRVAQQAFENEGRMGAAAVLVPHIDGAADDAMIHGRPHAYAKILFEP